MTMTVYENNKIVRSVETEVVLVDFKEYSCLSFDNQVASVIIASGELEKFLNISSTQSACSVDEVVAGFVPTGDGFYIVLQPNIVGYGLILGLSVRSILLNYPKGDKDILRGIRTAVHRGAVAEIVDITNRNNYIGPVMNDCARLFQVECAKAPVGFLPDDNYVFCSKTAFEAFSKVFNYADEKCYFRQMGLLRTEWMNLTDKHNNVHVGAFVELNRKVWFNPPRPADFDTRIKEQIKMILAAKSQ